MAKTIDARPIKNIINGGVVEAGHGVFFTFLLQDDTQESFHCGYDLVPKLIGNLRQYGSMAQQTRSPVAGRSMELASPYRVAKITRAAHSDDGKVIVFEAAVTDGFPVQLAMSLDQARQTIELLQTELTLAASPTDRRH